MAKLKSTNLRIGIVDDHTLFRHAMVSLLGRLKQEFSVTLQAENGKDMINTLGRLKKNGIPQLMIVDINMPEMDGFETVGWLKKKFPDMRIIVLTTHTAGEGIIKMFKLGINAYLTKDVSPQEILTAIKSVLTKGLYFSEAISEKMILAMREKETTHDLIVKIWSDLSVTVKNVMKLLCTDLTYEEIATKLNLPTRTIEAIRVLLFEKFKSKSRVGLVVLAIKHGLVDINSI